MRWYQNLFKKKLNTTSGFKIELVTDNGSGFYSWGGNLYQSDVIRSCIRPKAKAIGKLMPKHIRENSKGNITINPDAYMKILLEEPNPYMTGQLMQEKMATQLALNNNAFALIYRDENGYPIQLYPIPGSSAEAIRDKEGRLFIRFTMRSGKILTAPYTDILHLRQDYNEHDVFGDTPADVINSLMEIITASDQSIVNAIKNSAVIKWILKFKSVLQPDDVDKQIDKFVKNYLSTTGEGAGAAASDPRYDLEQVKQENYVPNASQMEKTVQRIYSFFNTNEKIVQSKYSEDDWNAYYESEIEPSAMQMGGEYSRKLFTRKVRVTDKIMFEASNLQYAAMSTKLNLMQMVDRGAMTPNEWRKVMNMGPIEGGEEVIRRLDTAVVAKLKEANEIIAKLQSKEVLDFLETFNLLKGGDEQNAQSKTDSGQSSEPTPS